MRKNDPFVWTNDEYEKAVAIGTFIGGSVGFVFGILFCLFILGPRLHVDKHWGWGNVPEERSK